MKLTDQELANQALHPDTLEFAVRQININGYITFENVLSPDFVEELRREYMAIYEPFISNRDPNKPSFGVKHYRLFLPFRAPFCDERVINNPFVTPILEALLGQDLVCHYFASNTCHPGSELQPVHSDIYPLYPRQDLKTPSHFMVLNIPLVDTTEENGPIEIWPGGTHWSTIPNKEIEKHASHMLSEYALMPAGSLMIRDGRMWHRGTRNRSNTPRPNIALAYTPPWADHGTRRTAIPQTTYEALSDKAKMIFRQENIGGPLDAPD